MWERRHGYQGGKGKRIATDCRFQFHKRRQLFLRIHNETLRVIAVGANNPNRLQIGIHRGDAAPTPTGFAEIVSDDFPVLHR